MKKLILKSLVYLALFFGIILSVDNFFVKDQSAFLKHHFFYKKNNNSLDLIVFGDSHTYCGISSDIIEAKTGLKTFNYGLAGVNFSEIYFNILEAFKYQNPKLIIIETYPFIGVGQEKDYLDNDGLLKRRYNFSLEGKKFGLTKLKEAKLSIPNYNFLKTFNIFKYHENWSDLKEVSKVLNNYTKKSEFPPFKDSAKDVVFMSNEIADNFSNKSFNDSIYLSKDHKVLINKIINLSKEKEFELLFVTVPFYKGYYDKTKNKFNRVHEDITDLLKTGQNIKLLDINKKVNLDNSNFMGGNIKTYNYNNQHLNYKGNIKVSNIISNYINDNYTFDKAETKPIKSLHDIFYNYRANLDSYGFEGDLLEVNNRKANSITSVFEGKFSEISKQNLTNINILNFENELDNPKWVKGAIEIIPNAMIAPDGTLTAEKIVGIGNKDGHVLQNLSNSNGTYKWSIWLKGTGETRLRIQENGGDYTNYDTYNISLTPEWKRYSLVVTNEDDSNNGIRSVLSGIRSSDTIYAWGAQLEVIPPGQKLIGNIIIPEKDKTINLTGWMDIKNVIIKDKFIGLKKDDEFSYISLRHQIKSLNKQILNKETGVKINTFSFEIPKDILDKGEYEIFLIARSDENKFYIKKNYNSISIK